MKSSETHINCQAPPKEAFGPKWSDFSFILHMTRVPKTLPLPHVFPEAGTRKQPVPPWCKPSILSHAVSPLRIRHQVPVPSCCKAATWLTLYFRLLLTVQEHSGLPLKAVWLGKRFCTEAGMGWKEIILNLFCFY